MKTELRDNILYYTITLKDFSSIYSGNIKIGKIRAKWDKHRILHYLPSINSELKEAYELKEKYREFNLTAEYSTDTYFKLLELITLFLEIKSLEIRKIGRMLDTWKVYIVNSFIHVNGKRLSNSPIEAGNSKVKTIIKNANGYNNFNRLRNKIIYSINKNPQILGNPERRKINKYNLNV